PKGRMRTAVLSIALLSTIAVGVAWTGDRTNTRDRPSPVSSNDDNDIELTAPAAPPGAAAHHDTELQTHHPSTPTETTTVSRYQVRTGDTMTGIAALHAVDIDRLVDHNGLLRTSLLLPGDRIDIPAGVATPDRTPIPTQSADPEIRSSIDRWSGVHGVSPDLLAAVLWTESRWQPAATSSAGAVGVGQLLPSTARWVAQDLIGEPLDPHVLDDNVRITSRLLAWLIADADGDEAAALAAYYQGITSVTRAGWHGDTETYVAQVFEARWAFHHSP
ncbi:MAG: transglycosylase SLT domain-containing protein, partial [Acidimicrobiales bacterium]|nr:transglycosylase SLT domain-containing protein [Acidimicrobiales bacterium]